MWYIIILGVFVFDALIFWWWSKRPRTDEDDDFGDDLID